MIQALRNHPQRTLFAIAATSVGMLAFGIYLQAVVGLEPCPMCIVQRYALTFVFVISLMAACVPTGPMRRISTGLLAVCAAFGAFVAARQSWLQWYPPETVSCGRDFYGMIENFPLKRALPMIFAGSGDCSKVDWTFLGLSIANWAFLFFCGTVVLALVLLSIRRSGASAKI
jgi:protein dithiol:quinone oxidoreductase